MSGKRYPRPIDPGRDLRTELQDHVVNRSIEGLEAAARSREAAIRAGGSAAHAEKVRAHLRRAYGPMPFGRSGGSLETRLVSAFDTPACRVENVLFDSFSGWQVNASVFVPKGRGPFPAVVIPVGHSGKQFDNYQIPAQAYASLGFLAVLFDPPGQASERQVGNDHFRDGVRCHLTGWSSNRYFVLDALRCIDYLESRSDADLRRGVGMTGVSGGGFTTACASLFDSRIACQGPSCCMTRLADHPIGDGYSPCPETLWWNRVGDGVDEVDLLIAASPLPTVYMAGEKDEVFHVEWSRELAALTACCYKASGAGERFRYFEDSSGHAYTLRQVEVFASWMNRWLLGLPEAQAGVAALRAADFSMLDYEKLRCRPSQAVNMFTLNRQAASELARARPTAPGADRARESVRRLTARGAAVRGGQAAAAWSESEPILVWAQNYREGLCVADGLATPVSLLEPASPLEPSRKLLYLDDAGRTSAMEAGAAATELARIFETKGEAPIPAMAVADLPGWGDCEPALMPFALPGWGSRDRFLSYISVTLGDGVLAIQTRAAVSLLEALDRRFAASGAGSGDWALVGRGMGGLVALFAAALSPLVTSVATWSSLAAFAMLVESEQYAWPASAFFPNALREIDLPELACAVARGGVEVLVLDPLDATKRSLGVAAAAELYGSGGAKLSVVPAATRAAAVERINRMLYREAAGAKAS